MTKIAAAAGAVVEGVKHYVGRQLAPIEARLAALEAAQHKTLADAFRGGWMPGSTYKRGELVQHANQLFLALDDTDGRPGESPYWRALSKTR
jgi:hypothetical protein